MNKDIDVLITEAQTKFHKVASLRFSFLHMFGIHAPAINGRQYRKLLEEFRDAILKDFKLVRRDDDY